MNEEYRFIEFEKHVSVGTAIKVTKLDLKPRPDSRDASSTTLCHFSDLNN